MFNLSRRSFAKKISTGIGAALLTNGKTVFGNEKSKNLLPPTNINVDEEKHWEFVKQNFSLEKGLRYFNNGSLGPSPEYVIDETERYRRLVESFPSKHIFGKEFAQKKEEIRIKAAKLLDVENEEIAIIHNTTEGMNVIASSFPLKAGDEVILADHEHPSGVVPWKYWQETRGVKLIRPVLPILPKNKEEIVEIYRKAITPRTKIISMCHIVNTNGMILPIKEVCELAHPLGIKVAVDGAQSSGMFKFSLKDLGCDFYATSTHKWLMAPKGTGLLYIKKEHQKLLKPLIVASGYTNESIRRFENYNTRNYPEILGLGAALDYHNLIGAEVKEARIFELKKYFRDKLNQTTFANIKTPENNDLSCGITTVEIKGTDVKDVSQQLLDKYHISGRPMSTYGLNGMRISLSIFLTKSDVDHLINAFEEIYLN